MQNPPEGWVPEGWQPLAKKQAQWTTREFTLQDALGTWQWYILWAILFLNVTAGISIISQAAPMAKEISGVPPLVAAGMVGIISIANGAGRLLWAWLSDAIGRRNVFLIMFLVQAGLFFLMPSQREFAILVALCFIVLSCYGVASAQCRRLRLISSDRNGLALYMASCLRRGVLPVYSGRY